MRRRRASWFPALLLGGALLLGAGCGGDDGSESGNSATATTPVAVPLAERVVTDGLGGLEPAGPAQIVTSPAEFAALVDAENPSQETASLEGAGFARAAVVQYGNGEESFGVSAAIEYESPDGARGELRRLYEDEFATDLPPDAERGELEGVPGSRTLTASESDGGQTFAFAVALFTDGALLYGQIAAGPESTFDSSAVLEAAGALQGRVAGRPAP